MEIVLKELTEIFSVNSAQLKKNPLITEIFSVMSSHAPLLPTPPVLDLLRKGSLSSGFYTFWRMLKKDSLSSGFDTFWHFKKSRIPKRYRGFFRDDAMRPAA
jgi:hypothetical protein